MMNVIYNIGMTLMSILRILKNRSYGCSLPSVPINKTKIYILGNGPSLDDSLSNFDKLLLSNDIICVNNFAYSDFYEVIKPSYYLLLDPDYWRKESLQELIESRERLYTTINQKTTWSLTLLLPMRAKHALNFDNIFISNNNIKLSYFNTVPLLGFKSIIHKLYKYNFGMPHAQNVLVAAIFIAINMGYKQLYLLGADHSWHKEIELNDDNIVCFKDKHFYDKSEVKLIPWEKGDNSGATWKMHEILIALAKMFEGYQFLEEYSHYRRAKIYNASVNTSIDAFTRYNLKREIN